MHDASSTPLPTTEHSNAFICPECGGRLEVYRTSPRPTCVRRVRSCTRCFAQFDTVEHIEKAKRLPIVLPIARKPGAHVDQRI